MTTPSRRLTAMVSLWVSLVVLEAQGPVPAPPGEWRTYHGDNRSLRYSPLAEITRANVAGLGVAWERDPDTGMMYVSSATQPSLVALEKSHDSDMDYVAVQQRGVPTVDGLPIVKPPYGRITALDLTRGEIAWQVPNGDTPPAIRNHPLLKGVTIPRTGSRSRAGLLATRTLLFAGEGWGGQPYFRALDKATGAIIWETALPAVQTGPPMTYLHEGRQYVAFTVGDQERGVPARLIAFALPSAVR